MKLSHLSFKTKSFVLHLAQIITPLFFIIYFSATWEMNAQEDFLFGWSAESGYDGVLAHERSLGLFIALLFFEGLAGMFAHYLKVDQKTVSKEKFDEIDERDRTEKNKIYRTIHILELQALYVVMTIFVFFPNALFSVRTFGFGIGIASYLLVRNTVLFIHFLGRYHD